MEYNIKTGIHTSSINFTSMMMLVFIHSALCLIQIRFIEANSFHDGVFAEESRSIDRSFEFETVEDVEDLFETNEGGQPSYVCGVLSSGKALVFDDRINDVSSNNGTRQNITDMYGKQVVLQTYWVHMFKIRFLQFAVKVCENSVKNDDALFFVFISCNERGSWSAVTSFTAPPNQETKFVTLDLKESMERYNRKISPAKQEELLCSVRISKLKKNLKWAIDDFSFTSSRKYFLYENFGEISSSDPKIKKCGVETICSFENASSSIPSAFFISNGSTILSRHSYMLRSRYKIYFMIRFGCREDENKLNINGLQKNKDQEVPLMVELSQDQWEGWFLVESPMLDPSHTCHAQKSCFKQDHFRDGWRRVVISLDDVDRQHPMWLRLRVGGGLEGTGLERDDWLLKEVYMGPACKHNCFNNGDCFDGICRCDKGYKDPYCQPIKNLLQDMNIDFSFSSLLTLYWSEIIGGGVIPANEGCGTVVAGESLYFDGKRLRTASTKPFNASNAQYVQFHIRFCRSNMEYQKEIIPGKPPNTTKQTWNKTNKLKHRFYRPGVLLMVSYDNGVQWELLVKIKYSPIPSFHHVKISQKSPVIMLKWTQTPYINDQHSFKWAIDGIIVGSYMGPTYDSHAKDASLTNDLTKGIWLYSTDAAVTPYCNSLQPVLLLHGPWIGGEEVLQNKFIVTKALSLPTGSVLHFKINVGCHHPNLHQLEPPQVLLQFSHDHGIHWHLVESPALPYQADSLFDEVITDGSLYEYGSWKREVVVLGEHVTSHQKKVNLRWVSNAVFALSDVYIGPGCGLKGDKEEILLHYCYEKGVCVDGRCVCDELQNLDRNCLEPISHDIYLIDNFNEDNSPSDLWEDIRGGIVSTIGCLAGEKALQFNLHGSRFAQTKPLYTKNKRAIQFRIKISSDKPNDSCGKVTSWQDSISFTYSLNGGVTWRKGLVLDSYEYSSPQLVTFQLPSQVKTNATSFKWFQARSSLKNKKAGWSLDDVRLVPETKTLWNSGGEEDYTEDSGDNSNEVDYDYKDYYDEYPQDSYQYREVLSYEDSSDESNMMIQPYKGTIEEKNNVKQTKREKKSRTSEHEMKSSDENDDLWFVVEGGVVKRSCGYDNVLEFSSPGAQRFAETWDYVTTSSTIFQFYIAMDCLGTFSTFYNISLQYSIDAGVSWVDFENEDFESTYDSVLHKHWTRVTKKLPLEARGVSSRLRWIQMEVNVPGDVWMLRDVYLGEDCGWMCSGHGDCQRNGRCRCDSGYDGRFCFPSTQLPTSLKIDFDSIEQNKIGGKKGETESDNKHFKTHGAIKGDFCGNVVSNNALLFFEKGKRFLETTDLNLTSSSRIEFYFKKGCSLKTNIKTPDTDFKIYIDYSKDGGITWKSIASFVAQKSPTAEYHGFNIPTFAKYPSTRIMIHQKQYSEKLQDMWLLDELYIGGSLMCKESTDCKSFHLESFEKDENLMLITSSGVVRDKQRCHGYKVKEGDLAMTYGVKGEGWRLLKTNDVIINDNSLLSFDLLVGCDVTSTRMHQSPVKLQYSTDSGKQWKLLTPKCFFSPYETCDLASMTSSSEYHVTDGWRHVMIPLDQLKVSGFVRFQWMQDVVEKSSSSSSSSSSSFSSSSSNTSSPSWAIDNVYIGLQCLHHCYGRGVCVQGLYCSCIDGFSGQFCESVTKTLPSFFRMSSQHNSGRNYKVSGNSYRAHESFNNEDETDRHELVFDNPFIDRSFTTHLLNLSSTTTIEFGLVVGSDFLESSKQKMHYEPILLQYSINVGMQWKLITKYETIKSSPINSIDKRNNSREMTLRHIEGSQLHYHVVGLPWEARVPGCQVRWWQANFLEHPSPPWSLHQIYIGGRENNVLVFQKTLSSTDKMALSTNESENTSREECSVEELENGEDWVAVEGGKLRKIDSYEKEIFSFEWNESHGITTRDLLITSSSFIQFSILLICRQTVDYCPKLVVEYSVNQGQEWQLLREDCDIESQTKCYSEGIIHIERVNEDKEPKNCGIFYGWKRISVKLPRKAQSPATRFRWRMLKHAKTRDFNSSQSYKQRNASNLWALGRLYIGDECHELCHGRGMCWHGSCKCFDNWLGEACNETTVPLPKSLQESFDGSTNELIKKEHLLEVKGGEKVESLVMLAQPNWVMLMKERCMREIETKELDLRHANNIQFILIFVQNETNTLDNTTLLYSKIFFDFSTNLGISWQNILVIKSRVAVPHNFYSLKVPPRMKRNGVKLRWKEEMCDGCLEEKNDRSSTSLPWAIDDVILSEKLSNYQMFVKSGDENHERLKWILSLTSSYMKREICGRENVVVSRAESLSSPEILTNDAKVGPSYAIQFEIAASCDNFEKYGSQNWDQSWDSLVFLEYSLDYGKTWDLVESFCGQDDGIKGHEYFGDYFKSSIQDDSYNAYTYNLQDFGDVCQQFPSVYSLQCSSSSPKWHRIFLKLGEPLFSKSIRFRWRQVNPSEGFSSITYHKTIPQNQTFTNKNWTLANVYIGPSCGHNCHGRGYCQYVEGKEYLNGSELSDVEDEGMEKVKCRCDEGFSGEFCEIIEDETQLLTRLSEDFENERSDQWELIQGGILYNNSLLFNSSSLVRQAVTKGIVTKSTKYVNFDLKQLNSPTDSMPTPVHLDVTYDGGLRWLPLKLIHFSELPSISFSILLPHSSERSANKLGKFYNNSSLSIRWWQTLSKHDPISAWFLDNVFVGGTEMNPSVLVADFETGTNMFEFLGNGVVGLKSCQNGQNNFISWNSLNTFRSSDVEVNKKGYIPMENIISTVPLLVHQGHVLQFKMMFGCENEQPEIHETTVSLEYIKEMTRHQDWRSIEQSKTMNLCSSIEPSVWKSSESSEWTHVWVELPSETFSSQTRFRWKIRRYISQEYFEQSSNGSGKNNESLPIFSLDDIYIGEKCEDWCNGRGMCLNNSKCRCYSSYTGRFCEEFTKPLASYFYHDFQTKMPLNDWLRIEGGGIASIDCSPWQQNKGYFFGSRTQRQALTKELDLRKGGIISFVIRFLTEEKSRECLTQLKYPNEKTILEFQANFSCSAAIKLQLTFNKGIEWLTLMEISPSLKHMSAPKRYVSEVPFYAKKRGVQVRWVQLLRPLEPHPTWLLDDVEVKNSKRILRSRKLFSEN